MIANTCGTACPSQYYRSPGSSAIKGICNYTYDPNYKTSSYSLTYAQQADFKANLLCIDGKSRIGYRCYNDADKGKLFYY